MYFDLYFTYDSAIDIVSGFAFQLSNDMFLYNAGDCSFWIFDIFSDFVNGVLLLVEDNLPASSLISFSYSFHKSPKAYFICSRTIEDLTYPILFYNACVTYYDPSQWGNFATAIFFNLLFNSGDLAYKLITLRKSYENRDWTMTGTYIAKVVADVFFKAPYMSGWNYKNSDVLSSKWGTAPTLLEGLNALLVYWGYQPIYGPDFLQPKSSSPQQTAEIFGLYTPKNTNT